jgi:integrase
MAMVRPTGGLLTDDEDNRNKMSLKVIQAAMGHANLATMSRYVGLVADEMNEQLQEHTL